MKYERAEATYENLVDVNDPAYRSWNRWTKAGRPAPKPPKQKPEASRTVVTIDDPESWRLELAQRRERLARLAS